MIPAHKIYVSAYGSSTAATGRERDASIQTQWTQSVASRSVDVVAHAEADALAHRLHAARQIEGGDVVAEIERRRLADLDAKAGRRRGGERVFRHVDRAMPVRRADRLAHARGR